VQTAQRIGSAIGVALLTTIFYHVLTGTGGDYPAAGSIALLASCGLMLMALISTAYLVRHRTQPSSAWRPTETQVYSH
jgi:hypothetical protein